VPITDGLQPLAAAILENAMVYVCLGRQLQGRSRELVLRMKDQQLSAVRCLKGIYRMVTGNVMQIGSGDPVIETTVAALRKNYGRSLKTRCFCDSRSADREYGAVFAALAVEEREHSRQLAELIGMLE
jgi:hypothetical protein